MAIQTNLSRFEHKETFSLDPAYLGVLERGMVMVDSGNTGADGQMLVIPATGGAAERVQGILWLSTTQQVSSPLIQELQIPLLAPLTVTLAQTPTALGNIRAFDVTTAAPVTVVAGAPGAGQLGLVGKVLTADAALAGDLIRVTYSYTLTPAQISKMGRRSINQGGEGPYKLVELCRGKVEVCISNFDTSAAWALTAGAATVRSAAGGTVALAAGGPVFARLTNLPAMHQTPSLNQAFVTIECNLPVTT